MKSAETKTAIDHSSRAHAVLSASGSSRWLECPGSVKAELAYPPAVRDESSVYAQEGTLAHELADTCLKEHKDAEYFVGKRITGHPITTEMARFVQEYLDYVRSHETRRSMLLTEERVSFQNVAENGFGTLDAAVLDIDKGVCHIFDLKYGQGITVDAVENTQAQLYAIGLLNELGFLDIIKSFRIHIVQPRKFNFCHWDITVLELIGFAQWAKSRADLALTDDAERIPGDKQCLWCIAKQDCKALATFAEGLINSQFDDLDGETPIPTDKLDDATKRNILDNRGLIDGFLKAVAADAYQRLQAGEGFPGYKLVEGRSNRKWKPGAEEQLLSLLGTDKAYERKLIGITAGSKLLKKDVMETLTIKPEGTPTMAPESDPREAINVDSANDMFDDESTK